MFSFLLPFPFRFPLVTKIMPGSRHKFFLMSLLRCLCLNEMLKIVCVFVCGGLPFLAERDTRVADGSLIWGYYTQMELFILRLRSSLCQSLGSLQ